MELSPSLKKLCPFCDKQVDTINYIEHISSHQDTDPQLTNNGTDTEKKEDCEPSLMLQTGECSKCLKQISSDLIRLFPCNHSFCIKCISRMAQDGLKAQKKLTCLIDTCSYQLKKRDIKRLPIEQRYCVQLLRLLSEERIQCQKCLFYFSDEQIDEHEEICSGRDSLIPCEKCSCPIDWHHLEKHIQECKDGTDESIIEFLQARAKYPCEDKSQLRLFINERRRKHLSVDIWDLIETLAESDYFSVPSDLPQRLCELCFQSYIFDDFFIYACDQAHKTCYNCYSEHVKNQMKSNQILTCPQCQFHLEDTDIQNLRLSQRDIEIFSNYQNQKICEYHTHKMLVEEEEQQRQETERLLTLSDSESTSSRSYCSMCKQTRPSDEIFIYGCQQVQTCSTCYECFMMHVQKQRQSNVPLTCPKCSSHLMDTDLNQLQGLNNDEIEKLKNYQHGKLFQLDRNTIRENNSPNLWQNAACAMIPTTTNHPILPSYWKLNQPNQSKFPLDPKSYESEYNFVLKKFNETMVNSYTKIINIDRIQNRRWFKQYQAHAEDFTSKLNKDTEKWLFHGCSPTAADNIIKECFNRSHAGANGVAYGCGAYFASQALYSHKFALPDANGHRRMFLARVLTGKIAVGANGMKIPPAGFDSTSDASQQSIIVVYHDAQAYGEYLITYM